MSFKNILSIPLESSEEQILAALYLLGKNPKGKLFSSQLKIKLEHSLRHLEEIPEAWAKDLAVSVLENDLGED